jgi:hypothetical protein
MQRMGSLFTKVARVADCSDQMAREFGAAMEQAVRDHVAEIEARDGRTAGRA